jgi:hypothetical protein
MKSADIKAPRYVVFTSMPKYLPQRPIFAHPQPVFLLQCDKVSHPHKTTEKLIVLYTLISALVQGKCSWYSDSLRPGRSGGRIPVSGDVFRKRQDGPKGVIQPPIQWVPGHSLG